MSVCVSVAVSECVCECVCVCISECMCECLCDNMNQKTTITDWIHTTVHFDCLCHRLRELVAGGVTTVEMT